MEERTWKKEMLEDIISNNIKKYTKITQNDNIYSISFIYLFIPTPRSCKIVQGGLQKHIINEIIDKKQ